MPIQVIEAPEEFHKPSVFLGGSITGASDWQDEFILTLAEYSVDLVVLNPRRSHFDVSNPNESVRQIEWEYVHLRRADAIVFWFAPETLAPITLLEFGAHTHSSGKSIFVGVHPEYKRKQDVEIQLGLIRPDLSVVYYLKDLVSQVVNWNSVYLKKIKNSS